MTLKENLNIWSQRAVLIEFLLVALPMLSKLFEVEHTMVLPIYYMVLVCAIVVTNLILIILTVIYKPQSFVMTIAVLIVVTVITVPLSVFLMMISSGITC